MKIAISGKGGSGKTTLSATLARLLSRQGFSVVAIDGDPNPNLGVALGISALGLAELLPLPRSIIEQRPDAFGVNQPFLTQPLKTITTEYGVLAPDDIKLLLTTRVDHAGKGWLCSAHATVRGMLERLIEQDNQCTILDMEASIEHLTRGTIRHVDQLLVVTEPYYRSLETAGRTVPLAYELGIKQVQIVANKVRSPQDEEAIRRYCDERNFEIIGVLPYDNGVQEADLAGLPILDCQPDSDYVKEVKKLMNRVLTINQTQTPAA
jgi:CO dehydrogenase maturation factor